MTVLICPVCQRFKKELPIRRRVSTPFLPRLDGKTIDICLECKPYVAEYNEWNDLEFRVRRMREDGWSDREIKEYEKKREREEYEIKLDREKMRRRLRKEEAENE